MEDASSQWRNYLWFLVFSHFEGVDAFPTLVVTKLAQLDQSRQEQQQKQQLIQLRDSRLWFETLLANKMQALLQQAQETKQVAQVEDAIVSLPSSAHVVVSAETTTIRFVCNASPFFSRDRYRIPPALHSLMRPVLQPPSFETFLATFEREQHQTQRTHPIANEAELKRLDRISLLFALPDALHVAADNFCQLYRREYTEWKAANGQTQFGKLVLDTLADQPPWPFFFRAFFLSLKQL